VRRGVVDTRVGDLLKDEGVIAGTRFDKERIVLREVGADVARALRALDVVAGDAVAVLLR